MMFQLPKNKPVGSASADGLQYESLVADEGGNLNVGAAAFEAAGEIRVSCDAYTYTA